MIAISSSGIAKSFAISANATLLAISPSTPASRVIVWRFFFEGDLYGLTGRQPTSLPLEPNCDRAGERRFARDAEHVIGDVDMKGVPAVTQLEAEPRQLVRQQWVEPELVVAQLDARVAALDEIDRPAAVLPILEPDILAPLSRPHAIATATKRTRSHRRAAYPGLLGRTGVA